MATEETLRSTVGRDADVPSRRMLSDMGVEYSPRLDPFLRAPVERGLRAFRRVLTLRNILEPSGTTGREPTHRHGKQFAIRYDRIRPRGAFATAAESERGVGR